MSLTKYGPLKFSEALAKIDELAKEKKKGYLSNKMVKGTAKYTKRGDLKTADFEWFVTEEK